MKAREALIMGGMVVVLVVAVLLVMEENRLVLAFPAVALIALSFYRPKIVAVATGLTLPFAGGLALTVGGFFVAIADVLAMVALLAVWMDRRSPGATLGGAVRAISPVLWLFVPYVLVASVQAALFHDAATLLTVVQRVEIVVVWTLLGATLYQSNLLRPFLYGYVLSTLVMSVAWIATPGVGGVLGSQKNPSGGFIAVSILLVVLSRHRYRIPALLILAAGLIATGSRGSVLGLAVACVVLLFMFRQWKRVILPLALTALAALVALYALPASLTDRFLSRDVNSGYTEQVRDLFAADALEQLARNPEGTGVGNYRQFAVGLQRVETHDPHNVLILNLVEGGWVLLIAFLILVVGTIIVMLRGTRSPIVVAAIAVQVSTLAHALFDVYWVRGTPAPGWALTGAALAAIVALRGRAVDDEPLRRQSGQKRVERSVASA